MAPPAKPGKGGRRTNNSSTAMRASRVMWGFAPTVGPSPVRKSEDAARRDDEQVAMLLKAIRKVEG